MSSKWTAMWIGVCFILTDTLNCQVIDDTFGHFYSLIIFLDFFFLYGHQNDHSFAFSVFLDGAVMKAMSSRTVFIFQSIVFRRAFPAASKSKPINSALHQMFVLPFEIEWEHIGIRIELLPTYLKDSPTRDKRCRHLVFFSIRTSLTYYHSFVSSDTEWESVRHNWAYDIWKIISLVHRLPA